MKALTLALIFISTQAQANLFQRVYEGYKNSDRLKEIEMSQQFTDLDFVIGKEQFDWRLGVSSEFQDSFLEALFAFQGQKTITQTYGVSVSKSSYKYGTFTYAYTNTDYDLSNWSASNLNSFSSPTVFESRNTLQYEYEILNRSQHIDWEIVHIQNLANKTQDKLKSDQDHFDFYQAYLTAKHKIILDRLYREFEDRAQKRVNLISRRVRDGLSRKVDLDQARLSLYNQQETIINNLSELRLAVATIEDVIKVAIPESSYQAVEWNFKPSQKTFPYLLGEAKFTEVDSLKAQNDLAEMNVKKVNENSTNSLTLNLQYTKNSFDEDSRQALQDSFGPGERDQKIVSLNYTIPLGLSKRDAVKQKLTLERNRALLNLKNREGELNVRHRVLLENIKRFEKAIDLASTKVQVAKRVVKENKRLYLRGQITFEESLRAEETLINARLAKANMLLSHERALAELAYLIGEIKAFLRDYQD